jgi:hypothetical protein
MASKETVMISNLMVAALALIAAADAAEPGFLTRHGTAVSTSGRVHRGGGGANDCIKLRAVKTETAETDSSLIFHAKDGRAYRNSLPQPCDGLLSLNSMGKLALKGNAEGLLCAGDMVWLQQKGIVAAITGDQPSGDQCQLGRFEAISEMSLTEFLRR